MFSFLWEFFRLLFAVLLEFLHCCRGLDLLKASQNLRSVCNLVLQAAFLKQGDQLKKIRRNHYYQSKPGRVKIYDVRKCVVRPLKGVQIYCLARWAPQNVMVVVFKLGVLTNAFLFIEIFCLSFVIRNLGRMCFFRSSWRQYFLSTKITLEKNIFFAWRLKYMNF